MADDQEQETAGVLVFGLTGELLLQIVHLLAVQVCVDLHVEPFMSNRIIQAWSTEEKSLCLPIVLRILDMEATSCLVGGCSRSRLFTMTADPSLFLQRNIWQTNYQLNLTLYEIGFI